MSALATRTQDRTFYGCPQWCRRLDHDADVVGPSDPPTHYGPEWGDGAVTVQATADTFEAVVFFDDDTVAYVADAAKLRQIAAQMVEAAAWLEGVTR